MIINKNASNQFYSLTISQGGQEFVLNQGLVKSGTITSAEVSKLQVITQGLENNSITLPSFSAPLPTPSP